MFDLIKARIGRKTHMASPETYNRIKDKIRTILNTRSLDHIGTVFEFNARLDKAYEAGSTLSLKKLEAEVDRFLLLTPRVKS